MAYQATRDYGLADLGADEVGALLERVKSNRTLFDTYFARMDLYLPSGRVAPCDDRCWRRVCCCIDHTLDSEVRRCLASA